MHPSRPPLSFLPSASTLLLPVCLHPFGFFPRLGSLVRVPPRVPTRALRAGPVSPRLVPGLLRACLHAPPSRFSSTRQARASTLLPVAFLLVPEPGPPVALS